MAWVQPAAFTLFPMIGGVAGSFITRKNIKTWYENIDKPDWRPPNWAFGPMWTTLYAGMGYASYLVFRDGGGWEGRAHTALALYGTQLALNWAWTPIFFGAKQLGLACGEISALWAAIAGCIYLFYPINKNASYLMVPYLTWVSLATALTFDIWQRNKDKKLE